MPWSSEVLLSTAVAPEFTLFFTNSELQYDLTALHSLGTVCLREECYLLSFSKFQSHGSLR